MSGKNRSDESRQWPRYPVSVPCTVRWKDFVSQARLANISIGGAQVTEASFVPPENTVVEISVRIGSDDLSLKADVVSRVVYSITRIAGEGKAGTFGIRFQSLSQLKAEQLTTLIKMTGDLARYLERLIADTEE